MLLAGFAGADQSLGDPYLFSGLTAVIVGGTTFMGARGDYTHTVIGALILTVLTTILVGKGYDQADQQIIFGVAHPAVVAGYGRDRRLRDRDLMRPPLNPHPVVMATTQEEAVTSQHQQARRRWRRCARGRCG